MNDLHSVVVDLEGIEAELELLNDLLQLYDEHREDELQGVSMEEPYTVIALLARQNLGAALLEAIEAKAQSIKGMAEDATKTGYELARGQREASKE